MNNEIENRAFCFGIRYYENIEACMICPFIIECVKQDKKLKINENLIKISLRRLI